MLLMRQGFLNLLRADLVTGQQRAYSGLDVHRSMESTGAYDIEYAAKREGLAW